MKLETAIKRVISHMRKMDEDFDWEKAEIIDALDEASVGPGHETDFDTYDLDYFIDATERAWVIELRDRKNMA